MESPKNSTAGLRLSTPKHSRRLYWPEVLDDGSPKLCGAIDRPEEVGWDDSPEPIKFDPKLFSNYSRKLLDDRSSPKSTKPRPKPRPPEFPKHISQENNDLALMDDLSRRVLSESGNKSSEITSLLHDDLADSLVACTQDVEKNESRGIPMQGKSTHSAHEKCQSTDKQTLPQSSLKSNPMKKDSRTSLMFAPLTSHVVSRGTLPTSLASKNCNLLSRTSSTVSSSDLSSSSSESTPSSNIDGAVQSFGDEKDDEWLSQIVIDARKTPGKSKVTLVKSRSDNHLQSPGRSPQFRRTSSFNIAKSPGPQPLKKQKSFHEELPNNQTQCSLAEIEKKRLEAKFRREYREIEKKKQEALRRLNERRGKVVAKSDEGIKR